MANVSSKKQAQSIDYHAIEAMESFNSFVKKKNTFLFSITAVFLFLYILLPILAFQPVLQQKSSEILRVYGFIQQDYLS